MKIITLRKGVVGAGYFILFLTLSYAQVTHLFDIDEGRRGEMLETPNRIAIDKTSNEVFIVDKSLPRLKIFDHQGMYLHGLDIGRQIKDMVIDGEGTMFTLCSGIQVFDYRGDHLRDINPGFSANCIDMDPYGNLLVANPRTLQVYHLSAMGEMLAKFGGRGDKEGKFTSISDVASAGDRVYVLDGKRCKISAFNLSGKYLFRFGVQGGTPTKLSAPVALAVDPQGRVFVLDTTRHTVWVADKDGNYLFEFGGMGTGKGFFYYPADLKADAFGNVLVADPGNNKVQVIKVPLESMSAKDF